MAEPPPVPALQDVRIGGDGFVLRRWRRDDLESLLLHANDERVPRGLERVMGFGVSAKATVAVAGKAHAAGQAGGLAKACNAAWRCDSGLPEGLPVCAAAAALPGLPWAPPKDGAGRLAATAQTGNASHPKAHNTL